MLCNFIYSLYKDTLRTPSKGPHDRHHLGICKKVLRGTKKILRKSSLCSGPDSKRAPPECKSEEASLLPPLCSVLIMLDGELIHHFEVAQSDQNSGSRTSSGSEPPTERVEQQGNDFTSQPVHLRLESELVHTDDWCTAQESRKVETLLVSQGLGHPVKQPLSHQGHSDQLLM
jgi:hypothetical protein